MGRVTLWVLTVAGALWACSWLLLAAVTFSDAHYRCPGMQCSDAKLSGAIFLALATVGPFMALTGAIKLRLSARSRSGAEAENGLA